MDARIECTSCGTSYPVRNGIPRFVTSTNYTDAFGYQWNQHRVTQLDSYTGIPISRNRLSTVTEWPSEMTDQLILEVGSGAGRFTEILVESGALVFSFDSSSAVDANWANHGMKGNLNLFQGDIFNLPLKKASFDKVLCLGVLQHTPDPEKTFKSLLLFIRPGGEIVIDIYTKRLISIIQWKYLLRPLTKRIDKKKLYRIVSFFVPLLLPLSISLRKLAGRAGTRLLPIVEYSALGLSGDLNKQWAILDTFDMYAPEHDHPQSLNTVKKWFEETDLQDVIVQYGRNGIVGKGRKPKYS